MVLTKSLTHVIVFDMTRRNRGILFDMWSKVERWSSWFKAPVLKTGVGVSLP